MLPGTHGRSYYPAQRARSAGWARLNHATGSAMLQSMRQATKSWASRAVIIVLALSFGAWGINDVFTGGSRSAVATVGEVDVPTVLFDRQFQRALQRERERSGRPDLTRDEAHQAGLTGQVLNLLVREYLLDAEAARLGLRAADASVMQELAGSPAFSNEQGQFDPELYDLVLERNNMTRADYEDLIRVDLLRDQILSAVGGNRRVPEAMIDAVHRYRAEERSAQLALVPAGGMAGLSEPGETAIRAYYDENTASFLAPERRSAVLVQLTAEAMVSEIELSDEDVYAEYEARIDEFDVPERRAVIQINAQDEALIREGAQRIAEGEDFDTVADDLERRGAAVLPIPNFEADGPLKAMSEAVFRLTEGSVSEPVQTAFGWHLFKVEKVELARRLSFEEVKQDLHDEMALDLAGAGLFRLSTVLEDELGGGASLEMGAAAVGVEPVVLNGVTRTGLDRSGTPVLVELSERDSILTLVFETAEGQESLLTELGDGSFAILRVDEVVLPAPRPLDEVRYQVRSALMREEERQAAERVANALAERVRAGEDLAAAARDAGLAVTTLDNVRRNGQGAGSDASFALIQALFERQEGDRDPIVAQTAGGWGVAVLTGVTDAGRGATGEERDRLRDQLSRAWRSDVTDAYRAALYGRHDISVNQGTLSALFNPQN